MPKALITGAAGMIGSQLCREFLNRGWDVIGIDNLQSGRAEYLDPRVYFIQGDYRADGEPKFNGHLDALIHLAAEPFIPDCYTDPGKFLDNNVTGTFGLVHDMRHADIGRLVIVSSSEVYGTNQMVGRMTERHPLNPQSTYAATKLAGEALARTLAREHNLPVVIYRPFNTYGPRCTQPYVIAEIMRQIHHGDGTVRLGNVGARRDFTYVVEQAWALAEIAIKGAVGETYHYGSEVTRSITSIAHDLAAVVDRKIELEARTPERMRPHDVEHLLADNSKARAAIGYPPPDRITTWADGLQRMWEWYRQIGYCWPWEKGGGR